MFVTVWLQDAGNQVIKGDMNTDKVTVVASVCSESLKFKNLLKSPLRTSCENSLYIYIYFPFIYLCWDIHKEWHWGHIGSFWRFHGDRSCIPSSRRHLDSNASLRERRLSPKSTTKRKKAVVQQHFSRIILFFLLNLNEWNESSKRVRPHYTSSVKHYTVSWKLKCTDCTFRPFKRGFFWFKLK